MPPLHTRPMGDLRRALLSVDVRDRADSCLGMLIADEAKGGGREGALQMHATVCQPLTCQSRALHFATAIFSILTLFSKIKVSNQKLEAKPTKITSKGFFVMALKQLGSVSAKAARAVRDGYAASMASIVSVFLLMWLRTAMSYQHVKGVTMSEAIHQLYNEGGVKRFYKGLIPALCMMPLSRFGDIFSNEVSREFFSESYRAAVVTAFASTMAASWRIIISPADTVKTMMQVHGGDGLTLLKNKISKQGPSALYQGALGASAATWVGHYP